jgi:hypothetical protein
MKDLKNTVDLMVNGDYRDRLVAEYWQLRIRTEALATFIGKYRRDELDYIPDCPVGLLEQQADVMCKYQEILERRAKIEKIALDDCAVGVDVHKAFEWLDGYAFPDKKEVYTNGSELVPMFRVRQAFIDKAYNGLFEG